ncbi:MAG TPA: alpha-galactosidase [Bryobacterales bacterium]|nr:alpha-galactosidase [Bryobacterales bacterium]
MLFFIPTRTSPLRWTLALLAAVPLLAASPITVSAKRHANIVITTPKAQFEIAANGSVRGFLVRGKQRLTLDDPAAADTGDAIKINGAEVGGFTADASGVKVTDARGPLGARGKRVVVPGRAEANGVTVERTATFEIYEDFPELLLSTVTYKNAGSAPFHIDHAAIDRHRLNAALTDPKARPYELWSFHGASARQGLDDVAELSAGFSRPNEMGRITPHGDGGGVPVVAFWTGHAGMAIGHLESLPLVLSIPVEVGSDEHPRAAIEVDPNVELKPGETYVTPPAFEMVYAGDYYEPLRMYSLALQRQGWKLPKPTDEDYAVSWCGWGYSFNVTAADMLGVIPKLKEFQIHWATLDDRWFDTYGEWDPRPDTFPGRSLQDMVKTYHQNGIKVQVWWIPIGVEIAGRKYSSHQYIDSRVAREHPDWLILDQEGKPALMTRGLAGLCPALPEVQEYHRQLTEKFIRDWGFDGHKLDNIFTVPACYNPKHHHKSPSDSINAMGEVYRVIFDTTRRLKPESVTQSCPCGTPPNIAWLPYMDQAVTADPRGSTQVRRRIKMYKALLGPEAPVYGDHVELTGEGRPRRGPLAGRDFASTIGLGGVVGTKFVWPQTDPRYRRVALTEDKDADWKKWMEIYHAKMLSRGEFRNLYVQGYDIPEGYAVEKNGKMYYAFFAPDPEQPWKGEIELRGLGTGRYHAVDYVHNQDLGSVDAAHPRLPVAFAGSLLLEVSH